MSGNREIARGLLPCPFCGANAHVHERYQQFPRDPTFQAQCAECYCGTSDHYETREYAAAAWNKRPALDAATERGRMQGWRPIADAPRDGTKIDVWDRGRRRTDVFWGIIEDWWCTEGDYRDEPNPLPIIPAPTHFQYLPAPPAALAAIPAPPAPEGE